MSIVVPMENFGGGVPLNFKVVGNPQPTNPKENTIWVNTDTKITSYHFSATQPSSPTAGMVWIPTAATSPVAFSAVKKNSLMVYPMSAKQYVSGKWVEKEVKIYQGSKWSSFWNGELYKSGNEYAAVTGGWVGKALRGNESGSDLMPTITRAAGSITASIDSSSSGGVIHTAKKVDLTPYKKIRFKGTLNTHTYYSNSYLCVWSHFGTHWKNNVASVGISGEGGNKVNAELDISSLSGEYYVGFGLYVEASVVFTEVVLE